MKSIYKYMNLEYLQDALEYGAYASKINEVNDPYEGEGIDNPENYGIVCATNSPRKMLLWSYYVNHQGCCVEYEIPDQVQPYLKKVQYDESFTDRTELTIGEVIESLGHKGAEWKHENEYRVVYYSPVMKDSDMWIKKEKTGDVYLKLPVKSVCFGVLSHKNERYIKAINLILQYNENTRRNVEIGKLKISPRKYELVEDRQFDIHAEIRKYG